jgi:hypothetical protein
LSLGFQNRFGGRESSAVSIYQNIDVNDKIQHYYIHCTGSSDVASDNTLEENNEWGKDDTKIKNSDTVATAFVLLAFNFEIIIADGVRTSTVKRFKPAATLLITSLKRTRARVENEKNKKLIDIRFEKPSTIDSIYVRG